MHICVKVYVGVRWNGLSGLSEAVPISGEALIIGPHICSALPTFQDSVVHHLQSGHANSFF